MRLGLPRAWVLGCALVVLVFLGLTLFAPMVRLGWYAAQHAGPDGTSGLWVQPVAEPYLRAKLGWTLLQAGATAALSVLLGVPMAWALTRWRFAGSQWMARVVMLPFVVPTMVAALGVLAVLGPRGWISALGWQWDNGGWLLLYGNLFFNLGVVVKAAMGALQAVHAPCLYAARLLGASRWRVFWRLEWPLVRSAVAAAAALVFLYCFTGLGLALVLGGAQWGTLEVEIYTLVAHELNLASASILAVWVFAVGMVAAGGYALSAHRGRWVGKTQQLPSSLPLGTGAHTLIGFVYCAFLLFLLLPLAGIGFYAINSIASWSLLWNEDTGLALLNTLRFSVTTVLGAVVLGTLHGLAAHRWVVMRLMVFAPFVTSSVLLGLGLLLLYPQWSGELWLLMAGYVLLAYPFVAKAVVAALDGMPAQWVLAARLLGASPVSAARRVVLPLLWPAIRRGAAFSFATAVGEFAVTLFLSRPEWLTLTTLVYQHLGKPGQAHFEAAMLLSLGLLTLVLAVFYLLDCPVAVGDQRA